MCSRAHIDPNFDENIREINLQTHAHYHTLFNSYASWTAKICLRKGSFHSKNRNKICKALKGLFGEVTDPEARCQILDEDWTPDIPVSVAFKLWHYSEINPDQLLHLEVLGKLKGPRAAIDELLKTASCLAVAA